MGKFKIVVGDVFAVGINKNGIIIHGANCFKTMGAGVARTVATKYREAYEADVSDKRMPKQKFGSFSYHDFGKFVIANAYTQFQPGANFDYQAIETALTAVRDKFTGRKFVFPEIGSGIAGGDKQMIENIMRHVFKNEHATLVQWDGK